MCTGAPRVCCTLAEWKEGKGGREYRSQPPTSPFGLGLSVVRAEVYVTGNASFSSCRARAESCASAGGISRHAVAERISPQCTGAYGWFVRLSDIIHCLMAGGRSKTFRAQQSPPVENPQRETVRHPGTAGARARAAAWDWTLPESPHLVERER